MAQAHYDDSGNARVDFVWGNVPMQPNVGRTDSYYAFGGGYNQGDNGWDSAEQYTSDTLNTGYTRYLANGLISQSIGTNHTVMYDGYSNFPGFLPNYAGDEDSALETVVPVITGLSRYAAIEALDAAYLDWDWEYASPLYVGGLETSADVTTGTAYMDDWAQLLEGLKKDDVLWFDWYDGSSGYSKRITVTSVNVEDNLINFKFNDGSFNNIDTDLPYVFDNVVDGSIYAGSEDTYDRVLTTDRPPAAGDIVDEGTGVYFYTLGD